MIDHNTGKKSAIPLIQDLNAFVSGKDIKKGRLGAGSGLFATLIHEAGHGIGLSHPHDSGLGGSMSGVYPGLVSGDAFGRFGTGLWGLHKLHTQL